MTRPDTQMMTAADYAGLILSLSTYHRLVQRELKILLGVLSLAKTSRGRTVATATLRQLAARVQIAPTALSRGLAKLEAKRVLSITREHRSTVTSPQVMTITCRVVTPPPQQTLRL